MTTATKEVLDIQKHTVIDVKIADIDVPADRKRDVNPKKVELLRKSVVGTNDEDGLGLINPISINTEYRLVAGLHRLEACISAGWETIPCTVKQYSEIQAELAEIDENLIRFELTELERIEQIARRKELYEGLYGKPEDVDTSEWEKPKTFVIDTAEKTGRSTTTIRDEANLGKDLNNFVTPEVKDLLKNTAIADNKSQLREFINKVPDAEQKLEVAQVLHQAALDNPDKKMTVKQALDIVTGGTTFEDIVAEEGSKSLEKSLKAVNNLISKSVEHQSFKDTAETWTQDGLFGVREEFYNLEKRIAKGIAVLTGIIESNVKLGKK